MDRDRACEATRVSFVYRQKEEVVFSNITTVFVNHNLMFMYGCVFVFSRAVSFYPKNIAGYWAKVAMVVGTRSAEECHNQHTAQGSSEPPTTKAKKPKKNKVEAPKNTGTEGVFGV